MRKYLSNNHEVAHYWGNQIQSEGQCGNIFFEGTTIYSYGHHFPIARLYPEKQICLFTIASYSVTTSAHKSLAYGAIPHNYTTIEVPNLNVENTKGSSMLANIDYQFKNLSDLLFKASRARQRKNYLLHDFQNKFDKWKTWAIQRSDHVNPLLKTASNDDIITP